MCATMRKASGELFIFDLGNVLVRNITVLPAIAGELGLPSAHYEWEDCSGQIRLTCRGIGHGYGLSQWGAQALYEQGYGWEEILTYYFSGVEITKPE